MFLCYGVCFCRLDWGEALPPPQRLSEYKLASLLLISWLVATFKAWHPQRFCSFFVVLLGLVAFFFSFFWVGGLPLPRFPLPPGPCGLSFLWVGGFPLPCFPGVFPMVLGSLGGRVLCFCFSCYLLLLASFLSLLQLGQHGLPTRKPPGPPRPFPWHVRLHPSPAGSRRVDVPRERAGG